MINRAKRTWENAAKIRKRKTRKTRRKENFNSLKRISFDINTSKSTERNVIRRNETKSIWNLIRQHEIWICLVTFDLTTWKLMRQYHIRLTVTKSWFLASIALHDMKRNRRQKLTFRRDVSGFVATYDISLCCYCWLGSFFGSLQLKSRFVEWKCSCQGIKPRFVVCISFWRIQNRFMEMDVIGSLFYTYLGERKKMERDIHIKWLSC